MPRDVPVFPDFAPGSIQFVEIPRYQYREDGARRPDSVTLERMLRWMLTIRRFEERVLDLKRGRYQPYEGFTYGGPVHLSVGQEGVAVGAMAALDPGDAITSTHRGHGHSLAKVAFTLYRSEPEALKRFIGDEPPGDDPLEKALAIHLYRTFAELLGKEDGYCHGRGGGMHIAEFFMGHLGANAIVAGSTPIAAGAAMAQQRLGKDNVVVCFVGDGALSNGVCLESFNFASQAQFADGVPVIYVVENNQYSQSGQAIGEVTGLDYLARRGAAFNLRAMEAEVVNGMDSLAVYDAVARAREKALGGKGPVLLEMVTYRYMGHSASDDGSKYRTHEEVEAWRREDPIVRLRSRLAEEGVVAPEAADALEARVAVQIDAAIDAAARAADPDPAEIERGVYATTTSDDIGPELQTTDHHPERIRALPRGPEGEIMVRHAILEALTEEMIRDRRVILYGEEIADFGGAFQVTHGLIDVFGRHRIFNAPISEAAIVGTAVGMALSGLRPVVEIMYIDFILQALDQVANQAAKVRYMFGAKATVPLVIRTTFGGGKGYAGQHSQSLEAVLTHFPGLRVVAPSTAYDAKGLLKAAIREDNPVIFIEHQLLYTERDPVPRELDPIPFGQGVVRRTGRDLTIIAYSYMAHVAMAAARLLAADGIEAEVVDPRTLAPFDAATCARSVRKTGRALVVTQSPLTTSFAEHIAFTLQRDCLAELRSPVEIVSAYDVPPPTAPSLEHENLPNPERVARRARALLEAQRLHR